MVVVTSSSVRFRRSSGASEAMYRLSALAGSPRLPQRGRGCYRLLVGATYALASARRLAAEAAATEREARLRGLEEATQVALASGCPRVDAPGSSHARMYVTPIIGYRLSAHPPTWCHVGWITVFAKMPDLVM